MLQELQIEGLDPRNLSGEALAALASLGVAFLVGLGLHFVVFFVLRRVAARTATRADDAVAQHGRAPLAWLLPLLLVYLALPAARPDLPPDLGRWLDWMLRVLVPVLFGWLGIAAVQVAETVALSHVDLQSRDNLEARKWYTQVRILKRIAMVLVVLVTVAVVLMSYERLRQLGAGLLASAGIAGVILGFAAQKTLSNLLAGFQIATTQPIRIDDVVVVEGEWGRVEEITLTYVVIRIWDLRRLVLPISYFIEKPFQNWTRTSAEVLGTVYLHVDYTVPVAAVRDELRRVLEASDRWDGKVWNLQVTDAGERTIELRALMSAADSGTAWDLRCEVREKLLDWLQREHPGALPRFRLEGQPEDRAEARLAARADESAGARAGSMPDEDVEERS